MHSVIQCLIRTPYFGKYLSEVPNIIKGNKKMIIQQLSHIYSESRMNKDRIDVTSPMNEIEKIIESKYKLENKNPFLLLKYMLVEMEKEFKDNRK